MKPRRIALAVIHGALTGSMASRRSKMKTKSDQLCVVEGCKCRRAGRDNWRCERHSVMYYGGYFQKNITPVSEESGGMKDE